LKTSDTVSDVDPNHLLVAVAAYYEECLERHGTTPKGVDWNGQESQELRHKQFLRLFDDPTGSVLDLGCGYGDFLRFLRSIGHQGNFIGYDVAAGMISQARRLHEKDPACQWVIGTDLASASVDYAIASGIFNVRGDVKPEVWAAYVTETIEKLSRAARVGFGFNVLSLSSDPDRRRPNLYYADPARTLEWCLARFGRRVALMQDYGLYEFTVLVRTS
jgi:SAM-dependent methyltransferase